MNRYSNRKDQKLKKLYKELAKKQERTTKNKTNTMIARYEEVRAMCSCQNFSAASLNSPKLCAAAPPFVPLVAPLPQVGLKSIDPCSWSGIGVQRSNPGGEGIC
jgi:hypothetical protein